MVNLETKYMGLELKNPVIVGASNLSTNPDNLRRIEAAGAAAVVYKSLFEEQIQLENLELFERRTEYENRNAEMITLFPETGTDLSYPKDHLRNLRRAKEVLSIPLIASLNAVDDDTWIEYAKLIEETGVDGIELNFYTVPEKTLQGADGIEELQTATLKKVRSAVRIPVAVKMSPYYTNPIRFIGNLEKAGADAFVLFNRLFQPDIDINSEEHIFPYSLSHSEDSRLSQRFAGLLYNNTKSSLCANSGVFNGYDVIKMLLAGADAVQVVSTLYLNQIEVIRTMLNDITGWMESKGYRSIADFRGKLSEKKSKDNLPYIRAQYMDFQMSTSAILKKYRVIS